MGRACVHQCARSSTHACVSACACVQTVCLCRSCMCVLAVICSCRSPLRLLFFCVFTRPRAHAQELPLSEVEAMTVTDERLSQLGLNIKTPLGLVTEYCGRYDATAVVPCCAAALD